MLQYIDEMHGGHPDQTVRARPGRVCQGRPALWPTSHAVAGNQLDNKSAQPHWLAQYMTEQVVVAQVPFAWLTGDTCK
ncbi:hypothetical protein [Methylobacter sp. BlB1]|uniref:hypothetical protein n=1 Tax=Methylobacter sp. BlB1 TaxID=2785914 RepID=UPI0018959CD1|nr:hypothetical protein [Methylobacter sp. BlB1]MBF6651084.1 hypothetical protein [Methylobacter sp. BlB1]